MKTRKSVSKRIRVTKNGKIQRRAMTLGHSRGNKSQRQMHRKRVERGLATMAKEVRRYIH
jgi:ribosomal protein L35